MRLTTPFESNMARRTLLLAWATTCWIGASVAHAQSAVTLYGTIDTSIEVTNPEYDLSPKVLLYASGALLRDRAEATFTLRGVNVVGIPVAYPGAPVRGVQVGMIERF